MHMLQNREAEERVLYAPLTNFSICGLGATSDVCPKAAKAQKQEACLWGSSADTAKAAAAAAASRPIVEAGHALQPHLAHRFLLDGRHPIAACDAAHLPRMTPPRRSMKSVGGFIGGATHIQKWTGSNAQPWSSTDAATTINGHGNLDECPPNTIGCGACPKENACPLQFHPR